MNKWISVKNSKRRPEDETYVLVFAPNCHIIGSVLVGQYFEPENNAGEAWTVYDFNDSKLDEKVTHWMPLPEPPKFRE